MRKHAYLVVFFLPILLCTVISAYATVHYLSHVYYYATEVQDAQLMTISPDPSTPFPQETITGQTFQISVNVENPNPIALEGRILVSFKTAGITIESISLTSDWKHLGGYLLLISKTLDEGTLSFKLWPNYTPDPYFTFQPGFNPEVVCLKVTYHHVGSYDITMSVITT